MLREPLREETRHGIIAVALFVVAGLSLLSFSGLAGTLGKYVILAEGALFGWARYAVPLLLIAYGAALLLKKQILTGTFILGGLLLLAGSTGMLHLFYPVSRSLAEAAAGNGGGYIGYGVAWPLAHIAGTIAGFVILVALFLIGLLVTLNTSLQQLAKPGGWFGKLFIAFFSIFRRRGHWVTAEPVEEVPPEPEPTPFTGRQIRDAENMQQQTLLERATPNADLEAFDLPKARKMPKITTTLPLTLLDDASTKPTSGDVKANSTIIQKTLENFGISVEMGEVNIGPTVTQYTLRPAEGVKLSQITTLANDLALALAAHPIRIEAPIPGKPLVGVEVPNKATAIVCLKEILDSESFRKKKSHLTVAVGKDVAGQAYVARLDSMPHLLVAGATGSGKSVCINSIIISLLYQNSPSELKFILVDPKRVELTVYNDIPHLITPVITDVKKTVNALHWAVAEMDRRYRILEQSGARNLATHNARATVEPLPYIVVVIDELADLMAASARDVESAIVRLAQMARAVGIHLVIATQRPSVDVITGLIKANITSRIAFSVASLVDSRTIIDNSGAEKLLGRGDMLYMAAELSKPKRLQGAFVSDTEIQRVVDHLRTQANPEYEETVVESQGKQSGGASSDDGVDDDLYNEAKEIILQAGKASASLLQRRLRVGYARAARLLDIMEEKGVIGPLDGARPREVLVGNDETGISLPEETGVAEEKPESEEEVV